jgi:DNA invertase Pin-like site-specific DNA recombinase
MLVGYARVSTQEQNLDLQRDALQTAGCERIFTDTASGAKTAREGLDECLKFIRQGDTLVVWKLDRLGRSLRHLIDVVNALEAQGIAFRSLQENIDTTTSGGKLVFHVFGALAEFERDLIRERTQAGLTAARARGRKGGRARAMDEKKLAMAISLHQDRTVSIDDICATLKVSRATLYRYLKDHSLAVPAKENTVKEDTTPEGTGATHKRARLSRKKSG